VPAGFGAAGYEPSLIPFLKERDIAALGLNLLDNLALDQLAAAAEKTKRWEFMLVVEPLRVQNGAGSPVNPVAVF
jgi:hypothetical protein